MECTMYMIININDIIIANTIIDKIKSFYSPISFSPLHECNTVYNAYDFYCNFTITRDDLHLLLDKLCDNFDEYEDEWEAYGITSKMFDSNIYYIRVSIY